MVKNSQQPTDLHFSELDTPQTVTITGIDDDLADGTITSTITLAVDDASRR